MYENFQKIVNLPKILENYKKNKSKFSTTKNSFCIKFKEAFKICWKIIHEILKEMLQKIAEKNGNFKNKNREKILHQINRREI